MSDLTYQLVIYGEEGEYMSLASLASHVGLHPDLVEEFVELGLIEPARFAGSEMLFSAACIPRLHTIVRLRRDIGVNVAGMSVILDLLDRVRALQRENELLKSKL